MGGQLVGVYRGYMPALFTQIGDSRVQRDPVKPGAKTGRPPERRVRSPKLDHDLLEKVLPVVLRGPIHPAYLVQYAPVFVHQADECVL